ncbi:DUF5602 domain-containing protein [Alicycliphilus denitrificans]|uniref:DUF5602 domain-containing protein n=1 Tax=Alicycliphilus denitrificans TaxID=179636 RepID=UPI00384D10F7
MTSKSVASLRTSAVIAAFAALAALNGAAQAENKAVTYKGKAVRIGNGSAHTVVHTDASGKPHAIGIVFTSDALEGLPAAGDAGHSDVPYVLPMPVKGPKTVVDHAVINWEPGGHPPPKVYDVPHFDFHFYLIDPAERASIRFTSENESGEPSQQPPRELLPEGYVIPPGTAVPEMGVHAINTASAEFQGQPFNATFIYGYYNQRLTFLEPMASLEFLKSKPNFSAPVIRPARYNKQGTYPSSYTIDYNAASKIYEVGLRDLQ